MGRALVVVEGSEGQARAIRAAAQKVFGKKVGITLHDVTPKDKKVFGVTIRRNPGGSYTVGRLSPAAPMYKLGISENGQPKNLSKAQQMMYDAITDRSKIVMVHNADVGDAKTPDEAARAQRDVTLFNPKAFGGGVTNMVKRNSNSGATVGGKSSLVVADVAVDFSNLDHEVAQYNGGTTDQSDDTVLLHEMAHAYGGCGDAVHGHSCAKSIENGYRVDTGRPMRDTQKD